MTLIYNRQGQTIAWINSTNIYNLLGQQVLGFIKNNFVYTYKNRHLGRFKNVFLRQKRKCFCLYSRCERWVTSSYSSSFSDIVIISNSSRITKRQFFLVYLTWGNIINF